MGKSAVKSVRDMLGLLGSGHAAEGHMVPANDRNSGTLDPSSGIADSHTVPTRRKPGRRALLDGNFARRKLPLRETEYCIWDSELAGFGLRVRPTGNYYWFVRLRHRGKHRRITLGRSDELDAELARAQARRLLAEVALDGLPKRAVVKATPLMSDFVDTYWDDLSRVWKASTARRNLNAWKTVIAPTFGTVRVADILPADIHRWRDDCAGTREGLFNRALPVLASLLKYAEALRLRRNGSNPCRGMPRYKREPKERYLTPAEYRRIGAALREQEAAYPAQVAIMRLLLFTGARGRDIAPTLGLGAAAAPPSAGQQDRSKNDMAQQPGARSAGRDRATRGHHARLPEPRRDRAPQFRQLVAPISCALCLARCQGP